MGVGRIRPCKAGSGGALRMPRGKQRDQNCRSGGNRVWLRTSLGLSVLPGLSLCVLGSPGPLGVLPLHPGCPLEGIPSPGVHFGVTPPLGFFVLCPGPSAAFGCLWPLAVPVWAPHSPQGAFWGAQSLSMGFSVSQSPGCAFGLLCTPQSE